MRKPELLIPAGSLEVLRTAVNYGADAVYIGGDVFSLRAKAKNFTKEEMIEGIAYAHSKNVKVYVTANIFAHNKDLKEAEEYPFQGRDFRHCIRWLCCRSTPSIHKSEEASSLRLHSSTRTDRVCSIQPSSPGRRRW